MHRCGAVAYNGAPSTKAWLQGRLRMTSGEASALVDTSRRLRDLPRFAEALSAGVVSFGHVKVAAWLARKVDAVDPALVPVAEEMLFENAHRLSSSELRQVAKRILENLVPEKQRPPDPERAVYLGQTIDDIWDLKGSLSPECGAMLQTCFTSMPAPDPEDMRSAAERRHDMLADLVRRILDSGDLPTKAGEQPHLTVLVHASDLRRTPGGRTVLADDPFPDTAADPEWTGEWDWDVLADWLADPQPQPEPAAPTRYYPDSGPGGPDTRSGSGPGRGSGGGRGNSPNSGPGSSGGAREAAPAVVPGSGFPAAGGSPDPATEAAPTSATPSPSKPSTASPATPRSTASSSDPTMCRSRSDA
ncbi:DUF222 domain-containing protein, partial [Cryptosporangium aurantiacum]